MCKYCERRQDVKYDWNQPSLPDFTGNIIDQNKDEIVIHDYQTAMPELIIKDVSLAKTLWGEGSASIYIRINYCPICGRKLGKIDD